MGGAYVVYVWEMTGDRLQLQEFVVPWQIVVPAGKVAHAAREAGREFRVQAALESGGAGVSAVAAQVQMGLGASHRGRTLRLT